MKKKEKKTRIVDGHGYGEFLDKYYKGYGKGRLLVYNEKESKYINKKKKYWQVKNKDGENLYCQVPKIKHKKAIVFTTLALLIAGGTAAACVYLIPRTPSTKEFTGQVSEREWRDSIENIVNVLESRTLHYKTSSAFKVTYPSSNTTFEYKDLIVDGSYEEVMNVTEGKKMYIYNYEHLPLVCYGNNPNVSTLPCLMRDYLAYPFGNIYDTKDEFTFDKENKQYYYSEEKKEGSDLEKCVCKIVFEAKDKIKSTYCEFVTKTGVEFKGSFVYTYGSAELERWGEDKDVKTELDKRTLSDRNKGLSCEDTTITTTKSLDDYFKDGKAFIISINPVKSGFTREATEFRLYNEDEELITFWCDAVKVYKNDVMLSQDGVDGWKKIFSKDYKYEGFKLTKPLEKGDILTVVISLNYRVYQSGAFIEITKPAE